MKKLLLILLTPIIYLTSCSSSKDEQITSVIHLDEKLVGTWEHSSGGDTICINSYYILDFFADGSYTTKDTTWEIQSSGGWYVVNNYLRIGDIIVDYIVMPQDGQITTYSVELYGLPTCDSSTYDSDYWNGVWMKK